MFFVADIKQYAAVKTVWPSGLRRWLKAPVRKGVGSNPTAVTSAIACEAQIAIGVFGFGGLATRTTPGAHKIAWRYLKNANGSRNNV